MAGDDHEMSEGTKRLQDLFDQQIASVAALARQLETSTEIMRSASKAIERGGPYLKIAYAALAYYDETEKMLGATGKRADRGAWTELVKSIRALREAEKEQA